MKESSERMSAVAPPQHDEQRATVHIRLLGGFGVERDGEEVPQGVWQRRSGKALAKMLAAVPQHRLHREVLMDRLWPAADPASAGKSLHQALLSMRRAMDSTPQASRIGSCVRLLDDMVVLDPECVTVDVDEFERVARRALRTHELDDLKAAAQVYGGELLPEDRFEDWAVERREELSGLYVEVLLALTELLDRRGASFAAIERARQALAIDPTREDIHRLLMRLYATSQQRHLALRQYQDCRQVLAAELDAEPDEETEKLYRDVLSGQFGEEDTENAVAAVPLPGVPRRHARSLFAGRERPLAILREKLDQLGAGQGGMVLISGEAGVGKTRLAAETALAADEVGAVVLWGTSYAEEGQLPYGPFAEALEEYFGVLPAEGRRRLSESYPEVNSMLASAIAQDSRTRQGDGTRMQLFAAIGRLLAEIGRVRPLLLVLDDLHAADEASIQLVHYLARLAQNHPWLLIAMYREEEVRPGGTLHTVVTGCMRRGLADRIELLRLSWVEAEMLVRSLLEGEVCKDLLDDLFQLSLGNALFLQELVHATVEGDLITRANGRWQAAAGLSSVVPPGAAELVTARVGRLSKEAGRIAGLAAVAGMECTFELLRTASELSDSALLNGLDEIDALRIIEARPDPVGGQEHRYGFRHPLFREALYADIDGARRQHLHSTVGVAMEAVSPDEVDALAYHWTHAGNDEKAIHYLERAADLAISRYAHDVAAVYYRDALARVDEQRDAEQLARLQSKLGRVLIRIGRYDDALLVLDASRRYYELTGNLEDLARTVATLVQAYREGGTCEDGLAVGYELLPRIGAGEELAVSVDAAIDLYVALAGASRMAGHLEETVQMAEKAGALARAAGNDRALSIAEGRRGDALGALGRVEEGIRILEVSKALAEKVGNLVTVAGALSNAGALYARLGDDTRSREYRERAADLFERLGYPAHQAFALSMVAAGLYRSGRWDEARRTVERVLEIHESIDVSWYLKYALCTLGDIELGCGEKDRAWECFSRAHTLATTRPDPQILVWVERGLADAELLDGRPDAARARLTSYLAAPETDRSDVVNVARTLIDALLELGEFDEADTLLHTAVAEAAAATMNRAYDVDLLCTRGKLLSRREQGDAAEKTLREAIGLAQAGTLPFIEGQGWLELGMVHTRKRDRGEADTCLERAKGVFAKLGARYYLEQTERAIERLRAGEWTGDREHEM